MSYSGPGLTSANEPDISSFRRLEAAVLASEQAPNPNPHSILSHCPRCVGHITRHVHFAGDSQRKHHEINEDGDVLTARVIREGEQEEDVSFFGDDEGDGSVGGSGSARSSGESVRPKRYSRCERPEKPKFLGAFR